MPSGMYFWHFYDFENFGNFWAPKWSLAPKFLKTYNYRLIKYETTKKKREITLKEKADTKQNANFVLCPLQWTPGLKG